MVLYLPTMKLKINLISGIDMAQKILIDLSKFQSPSGVSCDVSPPEGIYYSEPNINGLKTIRELAVFLFTCRRCEDAPCINVCPAEALEKDENGIITRFTNLCVSCKSCVTICPFGTMMTDFFTHHRNNENQFDLTDENELKNFIEACPEGAVQLVEMDENAQAHIYKLNDRILVKEFYWEPEKL